jgi:competence protein ComEC
MAMWFFIGITGGGMYLEKVHLLPLFLFSIVLILLGIAICYKNKTIGVYFAVFLLGIIWVRLHPVIRENKYFAPSQMITLEGRVVKIAEGSFNRIATISHVKIYHKNNLRRIRSKINVRLSKQNNKITYGTIKVIGKVSDPFQKMNPSDMDYEKYLMSQGIVATIDSVHCEQLEAPLIIKQLVVSHIDMQIEQVFRDKDKGIMKTLLIGNDEDIPNEIYEIYSRTGIGHVLSISGFHIVLLISILHILFSYLGVPYTIKYINICSIIWMYAFLTGLSTSTTRACIMATLIIIARCIWEEEDVLTSLAIAAWLILLLNPFQLWQVGFQLSFTAVGSLFISTKIVEKLELNLSKRHFKIMRIIMPWACVTLGTYPILAVHFYEVPFLCTLLNLVLIPLYSGIILLGWASLIISLMNLNAAILLAKVIIVLLDTVVLIGQKMLLVPLGTLCVGKPDLLSIIVYYGIISIVFLSLIGYIKKEKCNFLIAITMSIYLWYLGLVPKMADINYLYVGQGDSIVVATPHNKLILIDGGNFGKGKTVQKYIKYKGTKTVAAIIISHSHADHIGGVLELLDTDIKVQNVFVSKSDQSPLMSELIKKCVNKRIKVYKVGYLDQIHIDNVTVTYLTPKDERADKDANNNSLGCILKYEKFSALFTGDMDKTIEYQMCNNLMPVTFLKASHHGSNTATSDKALLKTRPRYAIISCGINNRYNHPHQETLNTLKNHSIEILRTDLQGAITVRTDGQKVILCSQIKGESYHAKGKD